MDPNILNPGLKQSLILPNFHLWNFSSYMYILDALKGGPSEIEKQNKEIATKIISQLLQPGWILYICSKISQWFNPGFKHYAQLTHDEKFLNFWRRRLTLGVDTKKHTYELYELVNGVGSLYIGEIRLLMSMFKLPIEKSTIERLSKEFHSLDDDQCNLIKKWCDSEYPKQWIKDYNNTIELLSLDYDSIMSNRNEKYGQYFGIINRILQEYKIENDDETIKRLKDELDNCQQPKFQDWISKYSKGLEKTGIGYVSGWM
jgi:hypothetical protein